QPPRATWRPGSRPAAELLGPGVALAPSRLERVGPGPLPDRRRLLEDVTGPVDPPSGQGRLRPRPIAIHAPLLSQRGPAPTDKAASRHARHRRNRSRPRSGPRAKSPSTPADCQSGGWEQKRESLQPWWPPVAPLRSGARDGRGAFE